MNPSSYDLTTLIDDLWTGGADLFIGTMPDSPDDCILFVDTGGSPPQVNYRLDEPGLQVLVRTDSKKYGECYGYAEQIFTRLNGYCGTINGTRYLLVSAVSSPNFIGEDEKFRPVFSINFDIQRTPVIAQIFDADVIDENFVIDEDIVMGG